MPSPAPAASLTPGARPAAPRGFLRRHRRAGVLLALGVALCFAWPSVRDHLRAASLLVRASGGDGWLAHLYDTPIVEENVLLRSESGLFRARIYRPRDGRPRRGLVLAHGVHYLGIDEPRLVPFARNLARAGVTVLTPELAALADYRVHASSVAELRSAVRYLAASPHALPGGVGILGLSFAGGLGLLAASDPATRPSVAYVVALGGHHDLYRVSRFLATDELETPQGVRPMHAHDYGLLVYFYAHAELFVGGDDLLTFRDALRILLHGDGPWADRAAGLLHPPAHVLYDQIRHNDKVALRPRVLATLPALRGEMASLSPAGHLDALRGVPVFLMHGAADDVMPPTEAEANALELRAGHVELLLSPAIKHVTVEGPLTLGERWRILHLMAHVLGS